MFTHSTEVRVRYGETDRMGYLYYGYYAQFYEVGRVEAMRSLGFPYKLLEDGGILLPVLDLNIKYLKPAYYDEVITVKTTIPEMPSVKIRFDYELFNEKNILINKGHTVLVFVDKKTGKPFKAPEMVTTSLKAYFK